MWNALFLRTTRNWHIFKSNIFNCTSAMYTCFIPHITDLSQQLHIPIYCIAVQHSALRWQKIDLILQTVPDRFSTFLKWIWIIAMYFRSMFRFIFITDKVFTCKISKNTALNDIGQKLFFYICFKQLTASGLDVVYKYATDRAKRRRRTRYSCA